MIHQIVFNQLIFIFISFTISLKQDEQVKVQQQQQNSIVAGFPEDFISQIKGNDIDKTSQIINFVMKTLQASSEIVPMIYVKNRISDAMKDMEDIMHNMLANERIFQFKSSVIYDNNVDQNQKQFIKEIFSQNQVFSPKSPKKKKPGNIVTRFNRTLTNSGFEGTLKTIGSNWNFDILFFASLNQNQSLKDVACFVFKHMLEINKTLGLEDFSQYLQDLENKYLDLPYHNAHHASDVTISFLYFIIASHLKQKLNNLEYLASIIACLGHDASHPGQNNRFLVYNQEEVAITYNDIQVLENMHCSVTFKCIKPMFNSFSVQDYQFVRKIIIEMILETDMSKHFETLSKFKAKS